MQSLWETGIWGQFGVATWEPEGRARGQEPVKFKSHALNFKVHQTFILLLGREKGEVREMAL